MSKEKKLNYTPCTIDLRFIIDCFVAPTINRFINREINPEVTGVLVTAHFALDLYDTIAKQNLSKEQYIETLKQSEFLNVKTFEELFGITASRQKALRSRLHDPLPCFQMDDNTMILYKREAVVKWLENYEKR